MTLKLITALGAAPKKTTYDFGRDPRGGTTDKVGSNGNGAGPATRFFPVALSRHIRPDTVCVLLTEKAKQESWDTKDFTEELSRAAPSAAVVPIFIPDGKNEDELWQIFERMAGAVEPGEEVVFDITHGLRSFVFLAFLSIAYLRLAKNVTVRDVYYGALSVGGPLAALPGAEGDGEVTRTPVFRLTPFVSLLDWTEHVATFVRYGNAAPMAELASTSAGRDNQAQERFAKKLRHVSEALLTNQPRALGNAVQELLQARTSAVGIPPFAMIMDKAVAEYKHFEAAKYSLDAQMDLARWYGEKGYAVQAAQLLRELFINKIIVTVLADTDRLYAHSRREVEKELRRRLTIKKEHTITELWNALRKPRNTLAHCGFHSGGPQPEDIPNRLNENIHKFERVMDDDALWKDFWRLAAAEKKLLLTPLGTSPGLLLTALVRVQPDVVVVVTSQLAAERIPEAVAKSGYQGQMKYVAVKDVFGGFQEAREVRGAAAEAAREMLGDGGFDVVVNLTGGTTVLQYLVERAVDHFRNEGCNVKRVVMVDRRPYEEQQKDPYVVGEMLEIDADETLNGNEGQDME